MKRGRVLIISLVFILFIFVSALFFVGAQAPSPTASPMQSPTPSVQENPQNDQPFVAGLGEFPLEESYVPGKLIVKLKKPTKIQGLKTDVDSINKLNEKFKVKSFKKAFSDVGSTEKNIQQIREKFPKRAARAPKNLDISQIGKKIGLERIYEVEVPEYLPLEQLAEEYEKDSNVEYAERIPIRVPEYVPTDPRYPEQWAHQKIGSEKAWDIERGSLDVIIAIVDVGVDYNHEDLKTNIWKNPGEELGDINGDGCPGVCGVDDDGDGEIDEDSQGCGSNGIDEGGNVCGYKDDLDIDDDENGYSDDIRGWDFSGGDNDPQGGDHGTHVAGIAAAVGDNGVGVIGLCSRCTIMPVAGLSIFNAKYAADNGADIISNSYGSYVGYSQAEQDIINYLYSLGMVIIASAGNANTDALHYPSSYEHVISVGSIGENGGRQGSFGDSIDIAAPGVSILSTIPGNRYESLTGTSMATPLVSGLAGLLLSLNPKLTVEEVEFTVINEVDYFGIDIPQPDRYIGKGRINALKALTRVSNNKGVPGVRADISTPSGGRISLNQEVRGIANGNSYKVEIGKGYYPSEWTLIISGNKDSDSHLSFLDTTLFEDGLYTLLLTVYGDQESVSDSVRVEIDNVFINEPNRLGSYRYGDKIPLKATILSDVSDYSFAYSKDVQPKEWSELGLEYSKEGTTIRGIWDTSKLPTFGNYILRLRSSFKGVESIAEEKIRLQTYESGWPRKIDGPIGSPFTYGGESSPVLADVDLDGHDEIIIGTSAKKVYVLNHDGSYKKGWENGKDVAGMVTSTVAVGNLDEDKELEIIVNSQLDILKTTPNVYVFNQDGTLVSGWPILSGTFADVSPVIIKTGNGNKILLSGIDFLTGIDFLKMYNSDGTEYLGFKNIKNEFQRISSFSPSYGDILKNVPGDEIVVFGRDYSLERKKGVGTIDLLRNDGSIIWEKQGDYFFREDPILGDIDGDGELEIVAHLTFTENNKERIVTLNSKGENLFEEELSSTSTSGNAINLADVDEDYDLELVVYSPCFLEIRHPERRGTFSIQASLGNLCSYLSGPVSGDIDGDGEVEFVIVGGDDAGINDAVYVLRSEIGGLKPLQNWPKLIGGEVRNVPAIGDIDKDGKTEIIIASYSGVIYVYEIEGKYNENKMEWPMFKRDAQHSGLYKKNPLFLRGDGNKDGLVDLTDAIFTLNYLFKGEKTPPCLDATDVNDDGVVDIADPIRLLFVLFQGAGPIPEPYPEEGGDLTADELDCSLTKPRSLDDGLVALYHFDENSKDFSGKNNHGFVSGGRFVEGKYGKALSFDGIDDYVEVPTSTSLDGMKRLTLSAWVQLNDLDNSAIIAKGVDEDLSYLIGIFFQGFWGKISDNGNILGPFKEIDNNFHHVALVYSGGDVAKLYVDGVEKFIIRINSETIKVTTKYPLVIGCRSQLGNSKGIDCLNGLIDEVRIYDRALTEREIAELAGKA